MSTLNDLTAGTELELPLLVDDLQREFACVLLTLSDRTASATLRVGDPDLLTGPLAVIGPGSTVRARLRRDGAATSLVAIRTESFAAADRAALFDPLPAVLEPLIGDEIAFDIETVPRHELGALPTREADKVRRRASDEARRLGELGEQAADAAASKLLALHPLTARIVSAAFVGLDSGVSATLVVAPGEVGVATATTELALVQAFWSLARQAQSLIGYNSTGFDLPVLRLRAVLNGVRVPCRLASSASRRREVGARHIDLMEWLGADSRRASLELVAFAFGIPAKTLGHGSEVAELVRAGRYAELAAYNLEDALATAAIYRRLRPLLPF